MNSMQTALPRRFTEDPAEMIFEKARRSVKTGETFYAECKGRRYDGNDIWVLVKAKLVDFIESEHPVFLADVCRI